MYLVTEEPVKHKSPCIYIYTKNRGLCVALTTLCISLKPLLSIVFPRHNPSITMMHLLDIPQQLRSYIGSFMNIDTPGLYKSLTKKGAGNGIGKSMPGYKTRYKYPTPAS